MTTGKDDIVSYIRSCLDHQTLKEIDGILSEQLRLTDPDGLFMTLKPLFERKYPDYRLETLKYVHVGCEDYEDTFEFVICNGARWVEICYDYCSYNHPRYCLTFTRNGQIIYRNDDSEFITKGKECQLYEEMFWFLWKNK